MTELRPPIATPQNLGGLASQRDSGWAWFWVFLGLSSLTLQIPLNQGLRGISVMLTLLSAVALVRLAPLPSVMMVIRWLPAMCIPLLGLISTIWSEAPGQSFRIGAMTLMTCCTAVIMADRLSPSRFISAAHCALMMLIVPSFAVDTNGNAMQGLTGSKNVFSYYCLFAIFSSLTLLLDPKQRRGMRMFGLLSLPICFMGLVLSRSAGSMIAGGLGLAIFLLIAFLRSVSPVSRMRVLVAVVIILTPVVLARHEIAEGARTFQQQVLKKDTTLTGRTYLWERAEAIIANKPILGHGYAAFWRQGTLDAEGLWRWAHIPNRDGFNFHNEYVDMAVALGKVGVVVFILNLIILGFPLLTRAIMDPSIPLAFFTAVISGLYLKTTAESTLILAWTLPTVLLFAGGVYGRRGELIPALRPAPQPPMRPGPGPRPRPMPGRLPTAAE